MLVDDVKGLLAPEGLAKLRDDVLAAGLLLCIHEKEAPLRKKKAMQDADWRARCQKARRGARSAAQVAVTSGASASPLQATQDRVVIRRPHHSNLWGTKAASARGPLSLRGRGMAFKRGRE